MDKLVFGNYTWFQNPEIYRQKFLCEPVYGKDETGTVVFQEIGPRKRTITGSGCFFGEGAYESFQSLAQQCGRQVPEKLVHPVWGTVNAYLTELEMTQEPRKNYVAYQFAFREADENGKIPK